MPPQELRSQACEVSAHAVARCGTGPVSRWRFVAHELVDLCREVGGYRARKRRWVWRVER